MLILGLDPGSLHTGFGLVERHGSKVVMKEAGRISLPKDLAVAVRLSRLWDQLGELVERCKPDLAALETPFHGMNSRSLIVLAEARGVLLAGLAGRGIEIREYAPAEVKSAVTGNGRADKEQVARMVRLLLSVQGSWPSDATDALALALCCAQRLRFDRLLDPQIGSSK